MSQATAYSEENLPMELDDLDIEIAPRGAAEPVFGDACGFAAIVVAAFL